MDIVSVTTKIVHGEITSMYVNKKTDFLRLLKGIICLPFFVDPVISDLFFVSLMKRKKKRKERK